MPCRHPNPTLVEDLRARIARLEGARRPDAQTSIPSGCGPLDRLLPERGFRRGTLVEWLADGDGTGVETLAMGAAVEACRDAGTLLVLDRRRQFHPPAAARLGIDLDRLIVVHADSEPDYQWALDQTLRCPAAAAVLAWLEKLDGRAFRRLQLAAEQSGVLGLLVRPDAARHEPSWADVRLRVEPLPCEEVGTGTSPGCRFPRFSPGATEPVPISSQARRLRIHLLRCRGMPSGQSVDVEIDDETGTVHLVPQLADPADLPRAAGA